MSLSVEQLLYLVADYNSFIMTKKAILSEGELSINELTLVSAAGSDFPTMANYSSFLKFVEDKKQTNH